MAAVAEPARKRRTLGRLSVFACAVAAQLIALELVTKTPFCGDDTVNQNLRGYAHEHGYGLFGYLQSRSTRRPGASCP